ncbi:TPA: hypothetical protein N0F65_007432 [Lagenidium giganteum]|uniref:Uncharacterized protein n=1 Tax=Lagenidium giganteum TaxID=4803 RepID=A0AAV2ZRU8_9STRA|nr:TPA: hypothetical protein N0F65_007432 [Lagenidium giganteum]
MSAKDEQPAPTAVAPTRARPLLHYCELSLGSAASKKVKFTCIHASDNFLACGTSTGSVHLYARSINRAENDTSARAFPGKYHLVKMISPPGSDRIGVSCVSICPVQKRLVVGTVKGIVYSIQLSDYNKIGEKVEFSHDFHAGFAVTSFIWDKLGLRLFSACNGGSVCQTSLRAGMSAFFGSADTELLLKEETGVVQLDFAKFGKTDWLLVSSQLRVLLLNLSASGGNVVQVGTKPRQGSYGACFFLSSSLDEIDPAKAVELKVFSSRPGRRVWVADPQTGTVSSTLKFPLCKQPTAFLQDPECEPAEGIQMKDLAICNMALFSFIQEPFAMDSKTRTPFLVSWNVGSSALFFLDPIAVEIAEWHLDLGVIYDLKVVNESVFVVLHGEQRKVSIVQSCSAHQFLDFYAGDSVKKSVETAIEYGMHDALVLETLKVQWTKYLESADENDDAYAALTTELDSLLETARALEKQHTVMEPVASKAPDSKPLQVIFKQRPQQKQANGSEAPDLFAAGKRSDESATNVTLKTGGSALHPPIEYSDALSPTLSFSKNIYAPDGSTLEARLVEIKELSPTEPVVRLDLKASLMDEIMSEVKRMEELYKDDSMNIIPTLKGTLNSKAAAKAFSTLMPGANILSNLMDQSSYVPSRSSVTGIFGDLPEFDVPILDPIVIRPPRKPRDSHECAVLRIAMSSTSDDAVSLDTEVLLEAISMDIWDSNLKYSSNLPIDLQFSLPDAVIEDTASIPRKPKVVERTVSHRSAAPSPKAKSAKEGLTIKTDAAKSPPKKQLIRRSSLSPDPARAAQRAVQKHLGANPTCDIRRQCMVGGNMATSHELENVLKREMVEMKAELNAAAATAEKSTGLARRLWPASGITRVCGCLTNVFLHQGELREAQSAIKAWLSCFDPTATVTEDVTDTKNKKPKEKSGWARGEALVDGDGLPLTRNDWNLVRTLVSTFFAIATAGPALIVRPTSQLDQSDGDYFNKPYAFEMGVVLMFNQSWSEREGSNSSVGLDVWSSAEAEQFISKYGIYLNSELAAEVCTLRRFSGALNMVLDQVATSSITADTCDEVVNAIAEKDITKAMAVVHENGSLCLLLHVLDLLLKKFPKDAIDLCVEKYPVVSPWNIERCLFGGRIDLDGHEEDLTKAENVPQTSKYLRYLVTLMERKGEIAGKNSKLVNRCIKLCFGGTKVVNKLFDEENRNSAAHWVAHLLAEPECFAFSHGKFWDLFAKDHVLLGLMELAMLSLRDERTRERGDKELHQLVKLIVTSKDLTLLERLFKKIARLPHAETAISNVLQQLQTSISIGNHSEQISSCVTYAVLSAVGIQPGMRLLSKFPIIFATTPLSMYHTIVESYVLSQRQTQEVNSMLEVVDTHVWSSYKDASCGAGISFPPQTSTILNLKRGALRLVIDDKKFEQWKAKCQQYEEEVRQHQQHAPQSNSWTGEILGNSSSAFDPVNQSLTNRYYEYRNSDWGGEVQLHDAVCSVCQLPVVIIADGAICTSL